MHKVQERWDIYCVAERSLIGIGKQKSSKKWSCDEIGVKWSSTAREIASWEILIYTGPGIHLKYIWGSNYTRKIIRGHIIKEDKAEIHNQLFCAQINL